MANAMLLAKAMFGTLKTEDGQTTGRQFCHTLTAYIPLVKTTAYTKLSLPNMPTTETT